MSSCSSKIKADQTKTREGNEKWDKTDLIYFCLRQGSVSGGVRDLDPRVRGAVPIGDLGQEAFSLRLSSMSGRCCEASCFRSRYFS